MIFTATLILFIITSIFSILSLHSVEELYTKRTKLFFSLSVISFTSLGIKKAFFSSHEYFAELFFNIWGYFYLLSLILILIILYLLISRWRNHWRSIIALAAPFITIILIISIPFMDSQRKFAFEANQSLATKHMLPTHVLINVIGEIFFFFSFVGSILYLVMEWQLRKKTSMRLIYKLPNLETIESFNKWAITRSLILLSLGIFIGMIMAFINYDTISLGTAKEIHIYFSWFVILGIFLIRKTMRVASHRISIVNISLFLFVMFLLIFSNIFITSGFHSFK